MKTIYIDKDFYDTGLSKKNKRELATQCFSFISLYLELEGYKASQASIWRGVSKALSPIDLPKERTLKTIAKEFCLSIPDKKLDIIKKKFFLVVDLNGIYSDFRIDASTSDFEALILAIDTKRHLLEINVNQTESIKIKPIKPESRSLKPPKKEYFSLFKHLQDYCSDTIAIEFIRGISGSTASDSTFRRWLKDKGDLDCKVTALNHDKGKHVYLWQLGGLENQVICARRLEKTKEIELIHLTFPSEYIETLDSLRERRSVIEVKFRLSEREVRCGNVHMPINYSLRRKISNNTNFYQNERINKGEY
jgi:hypothetical protein